MKKLIAVLACIAVVAGGTFGAYKINESRKSKKAVAEVAPVNMMMDSYWGDDIELSGMITTGNVQNVVLDDQKLVEDVVVKEGDSVKKGDSLLKYDITALELDTKQKENAVAMAEVNIKTAQKELSRLQGLKPSELMPEPEPEPMPEPEPEPDPEPTKPSVDKVTVIENSSAALSGDGSEKNPLVFSCVESTVVKAVFLQTVVQNGSFCKFIVYDKDSTPIYQWKVSGGNFTEEPSEDWCVSDNVTVDADGSVSLEYTGKIYGKFTVLGPGAADLLADEPVQTEDEPETVSYRVFEPDPGSDDYMYSRAELARMISDKEDEIKSLKIDKKTAELEYKTAQAQKESGSIISTIDGTVTLVEDLENLQSGEPFIVVQGQNGLSVTGYVGEMNLDKVAVGSIVNVSSWETGEMAEAEVKEISKTPISYTSQNWNENPNSSTYEFTAEISGETSMSANTGIGITIPAQTESAGIFIPSVYVREEDGKYYVMKADENDRLKKQYVKTGRKLYGTQIEIMSGLNESDKISFPYGKNIKEGIKTKDTDEILW